MATFRFGHTVDIHWNGYDIVGEGGTVFSIPDQLYEEFEGDLRPVEPTLEWIDTNEFQTLKDSVTSYTVIGTSPISIASTSSTKTWSLIDGGVTSAKIADLAVNASKINSGTATNGYVLTADGASGAAWAAQTGSGGGISAITGVSPISATVVGANATVSLNANYQTAGTYVTSISGTSPITASGTTAVTVGIDQAALTAGAATTAEGLRTYVKNASGSAMTKGQAVSIAGADGTNVLIQLASATAESTSALTLGLLAQDLANNAFGWVVESGYIGGLDTSTASAGQSVYLGNTPGSRVYGAPPTEPSQGVYLGVVARSNLNNGEILVKVQNGYELDELHDVSATSPSDGDIIQYKSSSTLWTKSSIANAGIAASVHTHAYQPAGTYVTSVTGTAPISATTNTATNAVTLSLNASYQTAGTYVTSVTGDAAVSASGTTSISLAHTTTDGYHHVPATSTTNSGKFLKAGATAGSEAWANIALSDVTTGNYVATVAGGTGVTVTGADANGATKTVAIGQAVATNSSPTFTNITSTGYMTMGAAIDTYSEGGGTASATSVGTSYIDVPSNQVTFTPSFVGQPWLIVCNASAHTNNATSQYVLFAINDGTTDQFYLRTFNAGSTLNYTTNISGTSVYVATGTSSVTLKLRVRMQTSTGVTVTVYYTRLHAIPLVAAKDPA